MNTMSIAKTISKTAAIFVASLAMVIFTIPFNQANASYTIQNPYRSNFPNDPIGGSASGGTSNSGSNANVNTGSNGSNTNGYNCPNCGNNLGNQNNVVTIDSKAVVSTEPALDVKKTSALIQGAAHVDSGTATVWFEWGTRVDKLDNTTRTALINPSSTGSSEQLTNLTPGTKYFYRIVARNNQGICFGVIRSFTTTGGSTTTIVKTAKASTNENFTAAASSSSSASSRGDIKGSLSASAANAGASRGFMPTSVIAWIIIIFLVLAIVMVFRKIQLNAEEKKKREEEAKKAKVA